MPRISLAHKSLIPGPLRCQALSGQIIALLAVSCLGHAAHSAPNDWAEGTPGMDDGATRDYYNRGGYLAWRNFLGDWRDAGDTRQGGNAYTETPVADDDTGKWVEWDVTSLVHRWVNGEIQNKGFLLRVTRGGGPIDFRSREWVTPGERPELVIDGTRYAPEADTYLEPSTYRQQGDEDRLRVGSSNNALLRFDLTGVLSVGSATLRLYTNRQYGGGTTSIGVFHCDQDHGEAPSDPIAGIAANYIGDQGIGSDPDVYLFADFESADYEDQWTFNGGQYDTVASDPARGFEPWQGKALRARVPEGGHTALNTGYKFMAETGSEPEEVYFRYYLRFGTDWEQTVQGGKMPGISGTYGVAGWGGRKSNGSNGWSARGLFGRSISAGNPLGNTTPLGFYCYHADMPGTYGDNWYWQNNYRGYIPDAKWHSIEQYARMNTPGLNDGILRTWVDGRLAFEKDDIRFRDVASLRIEQIWMNVYHGGTVVSPYDQHLYIDNVVIARRYIGPMRTGSGSAAPPSSPRRLRILR